MIAAFRNALLSLLPTSEDVLVRQLSTMQDRDWTPLAELFAARLPEFDAVIAMPDTQLMAQQVARMRGVPLLDAQFSESGLQLYAGGIGGEALLLTAHLKAGDAEADVTEQAKAQGLRVTVVGAAVERTSLGGRNRLTLHGVTVRAAMQVADTPGGLNIERRAPDRWTASA